jgi:hypothetical protein
MNTTHAPAHEKSPKRNTASLAPQNSYNERQSPIAAGSSVVYLTLAAVVRNQAYYVREWLTYHHLAGVERFIIVLHKCNDHTESEIRSLPFFDEKIKLHHIVNDEQYVQMGTYYWILEHYKNTTEWMLFIDSDEFMLGTTEDDLRTLLEPYEVFSGVAVHWLTFGCAKYVTRPPLPSVEHLTQRLRDKHPIHKGVKSFVKPKEVLKIISPHLFVTEKGTVTENVEPVQERFVYRTASEPTHRVFRCNHYYTRSMEDYVIRHQRGSCNCISAADLWNKFDYFQIFQQHQIEDATIQRFVPKLKEKLCLSTDTTD